MKTKTLLIEEFTKMRSTIGVGSLLDIMNTSSRDENVHSGLIRFGQSVVNAAPVGETYPTIFNCTDTQMVYETGMDVVYDMLCEEGW